MFITSSSSSSFAAPSLLFQRQKSATPFTTTMMIMTATTIPLLKTRHLQGNKAPYHSMIISHKPKLEMAAATRMLPGTMAFLRTASRKEGH